MDTTIPPTLIISYPGNNKIVHVGKSHVTIMICENNWVIRESKKRMGPIASNKLILNTCHSTSIVNATTVLPTTTIPTFAALLQIT
jgi:hypothetical protein